MVCVRFTIVSPSISFFQLYLLNLNKPTQKKNQENTQKRTNNNNSSIQQEITGETKKYIKEKKIPTIFGSGNFFSFQRYEKSTKESEWDRHNWIEWLERASNM